MSRDDPLNWMLSDALETLARAERLQGRFFRLHGQSAVREACWEPPVDMFETEREVLVIVALPGIDADQVQVVIEDGNLVVSGRRVFPPELRRAAIHRLELPQGRFERRIPLPAGRYSVRRSASHGCLLVSLAKSA